MKSGENLRYDFQKVSASIGFVLCNSPQITLVGTAALYIWIYVYRFITLSWIMILQTRVY